MIRSCEATLEPVACTDARAMRSASRPVVAVPAARIQSRPAATVSSATSRTRSSGPESGPSTTMLRSQATCVEPGSATGCGGTQFASSLVWLRATTTRWATCSPPAGRARRRRAPCSFRDPEVSPAPPPLPRPRLPGSAAARRCRPARGQPGHRRGPRVPTRQCRPPPGLRSLGGSRTRSERSARFLSSGPSVPRT